MTVRTHEVVETGPLQVNCQILADPISRQAVLVDPGGHAEELLRYLGGKNLTLTHILATHGHFDHIGGVAALQQATGCLFWVHEADRFLVEGAARFASSWGMRFGPIPRIDGTFQDGDRLVVAGLELEVIHTPGHTPGGVCFAWDKQVIVGDTLFQGSIGRTDLPGGDMGQLLRAIRTRLFVLPDDTVCYPGHGPATKIGYERGHNPFLVDE